MIYFHLMLQLQLMLLSNLTETRLLNLHLKHISVVNAPGVHESSIHHTVLINGQTVITTVAM